MKFSLLIMFLFYQCDLNLKPELKESSLILLRPMTCYGRYENIYI